MKHTIPYEIIYSNRKTLAIQITADGSVKVRAPQKCPKSTILEYINEKESWILKYVNKAKESQPDEKKTLTQQERNHYINIASDIIPQKTAYYASIMHVTYGRISIKEQKTRWGSCSSEGNLNFNWRLIFAPEEVLDYIVVHELAHRREMNHSKAFYSVVQSVLPDYKNAQKWLRENGRSLWR